MVGTKGKGKFKEDVTNINGIFNPDEIDVRDKFYKDRLLQQNYASLKTDHDEFEAR